MLRFQQEIIVVDTQSGSVCRITNKGITPSPLYDSKSQKPVAQKPPTGAAGVCWTFSRTSCWRPAARPTVPPACSGRGCRRVERRPSCAGPGWTMNLFCPGQHAASTCAGRRCVCPDPHCLENRIISVSRYLFVCIVFT